MELIVIKRDGSEEPFNLDKIERVVKAAGLSPEHANQLIDNLTDWAKGLSKGKITTLQIREEVSKELHKLDEFAAGLFDWYQDTKERANNGEWL